MDDARAAWVALALVPGIGPARFDNLVAAFHTPLGAMSAPFGFLCAVPGMSRAAATAVATARVEDGRRMLEQVEHGGGHTVLRTDAAFPDLLRHVPDAPPVLFAAGDPALLRLPAVAIVGSRDHTPYGAEVARRVAWEAADAGLVVVSGMARGLDAVAHQAALDARGRTIGVLGNGLGVVYPAANRRLYERMQSEGLLVTEFPPGERPHAGSFPRRNRIISGLARATVVVEAGAGSGALITAGTALEQGREVLAVPGPITSATSAGTNRLVRDGGTPYLEPRDLLDLFPDAVPLPERPGHRPGPHLAPLPDALSDAERSVAELLTDEPALVDDLIQRSGMSAPALLAVLGALEISGIVEGKPGRRFVRVARDQPHDLRGPGDP